MLYQSSSSSTQEYNMNTISKELELPGAFILGAAAAPSRIVGMNAEVTSPLPLKLYAVKSNMLASINHEILIPYSLLCCDAETDWINALISSSADASGFNRSRGKACSEQQLLLLHQSSGWTVSARKIQPQIFWLQLWPSGQSVCLWREVWEGNLPYLTKLDQ